MWRTFESALGLIFGVRAGRIALRRRTPLNSASPKQTTAAVLQQHRRQRAGRRSAAALGTTGMALDAAVTVLERRLAICARSAMTSPHRTRHCSQSSAHAGSGVSATVDARERTEAGDGARTRHPSRGRHQAGAGRSTPTTPTTPLKDGDDELPTGRIGGVGRGSGRAPR